jgi:hypothetical protein
MTRMGLPSRLEAMRRLQERDGISFSEQNASRVTSVAGIERRHQEGGAQAGGRPQALLI